MDFHDKAKWPQKSEANVSQSPFRVFDIIHEMSLIFNHVYLILENPGYFNREDVDPNVIKIRPDGSKERGVERRPALF